MMYCTVGRVELSRLVQIVQRYGKQVLDSEKLTLKFDGENLSLYIADSDNALEVKISARGPENGRVIIDSKVFADMVKGLSEPSVTLEVDENALEITSGDFKVKLATYNVSNGVVHKVDGLISTVYADELIEMVPEVLPTISKQTTNKVLKGIHFDWKKDELNLVTTDGNRMAISNSPAECEEHNFTVASKPIEFLVRLLKITKDENVTVEADKKMVMFATETIIMHSRFLEGDYPDYQDVIPTNCDIRITANTKEVMGAIKRMMAINKNNPIDVKFEGDKLTIKLIDMSVSAKEEIDIEMEGKSTGNLYNPKYFMDGLKSIDTKKFIFSTPGGLTASVIRPDDGDYFKYVFMPTTS